MSFSKSEILNDNFQVLGRAENSDDEEWGEMEGSEIPMVIDLFSDKEFSTPTELFKHCIDSYNFDFQALKARLKLDFYECIRLINYIRKSHQSNISIEKICATVADKNAALYSDDSLLTPFLTNDSLLQQLDHDDEDWSDSEEEEEDVARAAVQFSKAVHVSV